jgi:hypothetical protein
MPLITIKGYAGGGMYSQGGSAAEYVCLPHDPNLKWYLQTSLPITTRKLRLAPAILAG